MINKAQIFPALILLLQIGASVVYLLPPEPNIRLCVYWAAAATLTIVVTF